MSVHLACHSSFLDEVYSISSNAILISENGFIFGLVFLTDVITGLIVVGANNFCPSSDIIKSTNFLAFSKFGAFLTIAIPPGNQTAPSLG